MLVKEKYLIIIWVWREIKGLTGNILGLKAKIDRNDRRIYPPELLKNANACRLT